MPLRAEFTHEATGLRLLVEDDGRVAYAYLDFEGDLLADVWLYNVLPAPAEIAWTRPEEAPFLNPGDLCKPLDQPFPESADQFHTEWVLDDQLVLAELFLNGVLIARLSPGAHPGWSACATLDGPLAQVLT